MCCIVLLITFYLSYLNRVVGYIIAFILRWFLWKSSNAYFECGAFQFSPLGGRIHVKDLRYHSRNQSLRILTGTVTWRYWFWRVRGASELKKDDASKPCRIDVQLDGVEWFLYNRTPVYDEILEKMGYSEPGSDGAGSAKMEGSDESIRIRSRSTAADTAQPKAKGQSRINWLLEALPIAIHANTGSVVLGNSSTPMLLIIGFASVSGTYGAVDSRSKLDLYKQVYQFRFLQPKAILRTNIDYEKPIDTFGADVAHHIKESE